MNCMLGANPAVQIPTKRRRAPTKVTDFTEKRWESAVPTDPKKIEYTSLSDIMKSKQQYISV